MMSYYFVRIPKLPRNISHQSGAVTLIEYVAREGQMIKSGEVIAVVENWWARMQLTAIGPGLLSKTFFSSGTAISEDDPLAILICDPEDGPKNDATCELTVVKTIRPKPSTRT